MSIFGRPGTIAFCRPAAWACIVALGVLSLLPKDEMLRTGADGRIEHFIAYAGTMLVAAIGYGARVGLLRLALLLVPYAGVLELLQNFSPGRTPSIFDFLASSAGAIASAILIRIWQRSAAAA
jgi:hypothetical protein